MYNMTRKFYGDCDCCCKPELYNFYTFPQPINKKQKRLDTTQLTIHTDVNIRKSCVVGRCCEPEPVLVKEAKKSLVISTCTDCLEPGAYYTLIVDREIPLEAFPYDTYINVEPQGFFRGEVGLDYTEVEHYNQCPKNGDLFNNQNDNLPSVEIDGENTYVRGEVPGTGDWNGFDSECGPIPNDPAFPGKGFYNGGCGFKAKKGLLVPVTLDLHGNIATGKNFTTGRYPANGYSPYNNRFVLFYNNRGEFVLSRTWRRRSDYA